MAIVFTVNGTTTLDETAGLQNGSSIPLGDRDDSDVLLTKLQADVPTFYNRLFGTGLALPTTFANTVGVAESADNFIQITTTSDISNLSFTDGSGNALAGVDSGLNTLTGGPILLFTDPTNDNIVLGRTGGASGPVVFAAYIDEQTNTAGDITGAKIWMVTLAPIAHDDPANPDDFAAIFNDTLFVSASEDLTFNLNTLASGQNRWNVFGDADDQIIVIPDQTNQTVNTSKGGGQTTIGNSNQLMDGVGSSQDADGEKMIFTFVENSPNLFTTDKGDPALISYDALKTSTGGEWTISQTQGGSPSATATMTALSTDKELGGGADGFVGGLGDDTIVPITSVTITNGAGVVLLDGVTEDTTISRTVGKTTFNLVVDFKADGTVEVSGLRAKDAIAYTTETEHNRLSLHNTGLDASTLDWDIGGFKLLESGVESVDVGPDLRIEDDAPRAVSVDLGLVHEDALSAAADLSNGNGEATSPPQVKSISGDLDIAVTTGTDAPAVYTLANASTGPALTSKGEAVTYNVSGTTLTATAGGRIVFTWDVSADGAWTFDLNDQLDHAGTGDSGTLSIDLTPFLVVKDADGDPASLPAGSVTIDVENDVPVASGETVSAAVQEDALASGNGETTTPVQTASATGSVAALVTSGADEDATWALSADTSGLPSLTSKGDAVTYSVSGTTLTAVAGGRPVFTLSLTASGAYVFELQDQIDHQGTGDSETLGLDLSSVLVATDSDGDSTKPGANAFVITVENDVPEIGPIANGAVDFAAGESVTVSLNGALGADENDASNETGGGAKTYTFASFTTDTSGVADLKGQLIEGDTRVVYFTDAASGGTANVYDASLDKLFFDVVLNQSSGEYTFTVYEEPAPALIEFNLNTLASGQNRWNVFGDADDQIIVIPDQTNQTVNTSKGGGQTTIGNSNQLMDGVGSSQDADGEKMIFTFVENSPNLFTTDKGDPALISYDALKTSTGGEWTISQTQGGSPSATATMTALSTDKELGGGADGFVGGLGDDTIVPITSVTITNGAGVVLLDGVTEDTTISRTVGKTTFNLVVDFKADGTVEVSGLRAKDAIAYTTETEHNRLSLHNTGLDASTLDWDIGGFKLFDAEPTPDQQFDYEVDVTDYDGDKDTDSFSVGVDGTGVYDSGNASADTFLFV